MKTATARPATLNTSGNPVPECMHHAVAQLTGPPRVERTRHLSQGCQLAGQQDGGFSGALLERRHRAEPRHLLDSFC